MPLVSFRAAKVAHALALVTVLAVAGCSSSSEDGATSTSSRSDEAFVSEVTTGMHAALLADIDVLAKAAADMQAAAPAPSGRGWDPTADAPAIASMKASWGRARAAYEHVEGAIAPLFPEIDAAIDERYDGFLEELGPEGDRNLFDGEGVTGMHAVERILWSDAMPEDVAKFEASLPGYVKAAFPATEAEARDFKEKLLGKLITDLKGLRAEWQPAKIDVASAFGGLVGLLNEQAEKVSNAADGAEESRYSQQTMLDVRANLVGTKKIYAIFSPWIASKAGGREVDEKVNAGFARLEALYEKVPGDAIPAPPATWSAETPSPADLATPFGVLYSGVRAEVDAASESAAAKVMEQAGLLVGIQPAR